MPTLTLTTNDDFLDLSGTPAGGEATTVAALDGNDTIIGTQGADVIYGGVGNDWLDSRGADGTLYGGVGNDVLVAAFGDTVYGGGTSTVSLPGDDDVLNVARLIPPGGSFRTIPSLTDPDDGIVEILDAAGTVIGAVTYFEIERPPGFPCFAAGTQISTPAGPRAVEDLVQGDLVRSWDGRTLPVRWAGKRTLQGYGKMAPVRVQAGTLGAKADLEISQLHRLLVISPWAELMFGTPAVLVPAKHLVNGTTVRLSPAPAVTYCHLLFDRHEVVVANGAPAEAFHPGQQGLNWLGHEMREEIYAIFPQLRADITRYGPDCFPTLKGYEAAALANRILTAGRT